MPTMKSVYEHYYPKLIKTLPMEDVIFIAQLFVKDFLPGDTEEAIKAEKTRARKAAFFLDKTITPTFSYDGSSPMFLNLLNVMMDADYMSLTSLAKEIESKLTITGTI